MQSEFGIIGIGTMGRNLSLNFVRNEITLSVYDANSSQLDKLINITDENTVQAYTDLEEFVTSLELPRKILLMVKAGQVTESVINELKPYLDNDDIVIDGGNANYHDTTRRVKELNEIGISYIGAGISGGAEGARTGPSIMPGGNKNGWPHIKPYLQKIAAKTKNGNPCCEWIGPEGSGHYVKAVHNGIEYGDMELIAEIYDIIRHLTTQSPEDIAHVFATWNQGRLSSYLVEITSEILNTIDKETSKSLIDTILDSAGQKGTGKWTVISALKLGYPATIIAAAVFQRFLSAQKQERLSASKMFPDKNFVLKKLDNQLQKHLETALFVSRLLCYSQGFALIDRASNKNGWNIAKDKIARIWQSGCIIRSDFLEDIQMIFENDPELDNLVLSKVFREDLVRGINSLCHIIQMATGSHISIPALSAALAYFDGYRTEILPANLIQAQRDYFGSHGYIRIDKSGSEKTTHNWDTS